MIPENRGIRPATFHHTSLPGRLLRSYDRVSHINSTEIRLQAPRPIILFFGINNNNILAVLKLLETKKNAR